MREFYAIIYQSVFLSLDKRITKSVIVCLTLLLVALIALLKNIYGV